MNEEHDERDAASDGEPDDIPVGRWIYLGDRTVQDSGRLNLPAESYGLGEDDAVNVIVGFGADDAVYVSDARIDSNGRVTIPARQRRLHNINDGDSVTVEFQPTGERYPDDPTDSDDETETEE